MIDPIGEPVWYPEAAVAPGMGSTEVVIAADDRPVAVLWIPDPEQRHGWREYYVKKDTPKPNARPMGYRK